MKKLLLILPGLVLNSALASTQVAPAGASVSPAVGTQVVAAKSEEEKAVTDNTAAEKTVNAEQQAEIRNQHFSNIDELVSLRAPGLAFKYLEREQPKYNPEAPAEWLYWEQKRVLLLKFMNRWAELDQRVSDHEKDLASLKVATADRNWFFTEQLRAIVEMKDYSRALARSRELLWNASDRVRSRSLAAWRRVIIQVYLDQNRTGDAQIAMRRYQQDYGELQDEDGLSWQQLQAELYIQLGQYSDAIQLLSQVKNPNARALQLLAMMKDHAMSPQDVLANAGSNQFSDSEAPQEQQLSQYLMLVAKLQLEQWSDAIERMEALLSQENLMLGETLQQLGGINVDADALWALYLKNGNAYGNQQGLLKGNDESWYLLAEKHQDKQPVIARSLLAVLGLQSRDEAHRQQSLKTLAKMLEEKQQALLLVNRLFTESRRVGDMSHVPPEVRYQLIDYNLSQGEISAAARLMADLQQPPADQPQFDWNLRRARVLILSGSFREGGDLLNEMLKQQAPKQEEVDKYLQVVFDLQAVEQHKIALELFGQLQGLVSDVKVQREITFWRAESYAGLKLYDQAAYLFMRSAISPDRVYDPWYHTATFRAAESLMEAGLYEDARQRLLHLLKITVNTARKAVIRQRLQTIQLKTQQH